MFAQQKGGCLLHGTAVQRPENPSGPARFDGRAHGRLEQDVGVTSRDGTGAGMKSVGDGARPLHRNGGRKKGVGTSDPRNPRPLNTGIEVNDLHQAVNAGVRPSGADRGNGLCGKEAQGSFKLVLNGQARWLALPSLGAEPVVADPKGQPHGPSVRTFRGMAASVQLGQETLCLGLQRSGGAGHHLFHQSPGTI